MKTIFERDGKFYRRLPAGARLRPTDVAAWKRIKNIEDDPDWAQVLKIKWLVETSPNALVFLTSAGSQATGKQSRLTAARNHAGAKQKE